MSGQEPERSRRGFDFVEASDDRVLTDPAFFWRHRRTGEVVDATNTEIAAYLGDS